jgi:methyltransferase
MLGPVNISVAIPDSFLSDEQTLRDKTLKISQIARASSIFRVKTIYLYQDGGIHAAKADRRLIKLILGYLDTPQYLRKGLFPQMPELRYAGILPPIRAPHHKEWQDIKSVREGEVRVGVVVQVKDKLYVDIGLGPLIRFEGVAAAGTKVNVKLKSSFPNLRAEKINQQDIKSSYWGFEVNDAKSLHTLLDQMSDMEIIITLREGESLKNFEPSLSQKLRVKRKILVVFGSPKRGVDEILTSEGFDVHSYPFVTNMFPFQGTQTVRLEEAFLGTLAIINYYLNS